MEDEIYDWKAVNKEIARLRIDYDDWFHRAPTRFKKYRKSSNNQPKRKRKHG